MRGCAEYRPLGAEGTKNHADRIGQCTEWPLQIAGTICGIPTQIRKDCPPGLRGLLHIRDRTGDIVC